MIVWKSLERDFQSTTLRFSKALQAEHTPSESKLKSGFVDGSRHLVQCVIFTFHLALKSTTSKLEVDIRTSIGSPSGESQVGSCPQYHPHR